MFGITRPIIWMDGWMVGWSDGQMAVISGHILLRTPTVLINCVNSVYQLGLTVRYMYIS